MASAEQYLQQLQSINLRFAGNTTEEATAALEECTRLQGELRRMKGSVQLEVKNLRAAYEQRMVSPAPVSSTLFTLFGKRKIAGSLRADAKRGLRIDRDRAIEPYEAVKRAIDDLLHQLADAKRQLSQFLRTQKATAKIKAPARGTERGLPKDKTAFCAQCGARMARSDKFCRECGAGAQASSPHSGRRTVEGVSQEPAWLLEARRLLTEGQRIQAIRLVRENTELSPLKAKELVESWRSALPSEMAPKPASGASD